MQSFLKENWERIIFAIVGFAFLGFSFLYLFEGLLAEASATFAMAFFSLIYSNLARFKRFKGLGFEAELWEDKKKEAASLIKQLQAVVKIYTREIILTKVMQNRWGGGESGWPSYWNLYDELTSQHEQLGQEIDFSDLKQELDAIFVFDLSIKSMEPLQKNIRDGEQKLVKLSARNSAAPLRTRLVMDRGTRNLVTCQRNLTTYCRYQRRATFLARS